MTLLLFAIDNSPSSAVSTGSTSPLDLAKLFVKRLISIYKRSLITVRDYQWDTVVFVLSHPLPSSSPDSAETRARSRVVSESLKNHVLTIALPEFIEGMVDEVLRVPVSSSEDAALDSDSRQPVTLDHSGSGSMRALHMALDYLHLRAAVDGHALKLGFHPHETDTRYIFWMTNEQVPANFSLPSLSTPGSEAYAQRTRLDQFLFHISSHSLMLPDIEITLGAYLFRSTYQVLCAVTHLFFGEDDPAMSYVKGRYGDHPIRAQFSRGRWIGLLKCLLGNQVWAEFTNAQEFQPPERLILQFTEDDMKGKYPIAQQHQRDPQPGSRCSFPELCFAAKQQPPPSLATLAISFDRYIIDPRSKVARTAISWLSKGTLFVHVKGLRTATPSELGPPIGFVSVSPIRGGGHDVVMFIGPYDFLGLDGLLKEVLQCKELGERALERLKQKEEVDYDLCDHDGEVDSRDLDSGEVKVSGAFLDGLSRYVKEMPKYYDERIYQICQRYSVSGFYEAIRPSKGESARAELDTRLYVSHSRPLHQKSIEMLRAIKESSMSAISGDVKQPSILKQIQSSSEPIILYPFENLLNTSKEDLVPVVRWLQRHFEDEVFGQGTEREPNLSLETESPSEQMAIHNESDGDMVVGADDAPLARERVSGGDVVDLMDVDEGTISVRDIQCLTGDDHNNYVPDFERVVIKSSKVQESVRQRLIVAFQSLTESWSSTSFNFVNNELVAMSKLHSAELDEDFLANICEVFLRLCHRVDVFKRFLVPKSVQQMALSYRRKGLADRLGEIQRKCFEELQGRFNARIESQVPG